MSKPHTESIETVTVKDLRPGDVVPGHPRPKVVDRVFDGIANGLHSIVIVYTDGERDTGLSWNTAIYRFAI